MTAVARGGKSTTPVVSIVIPVRDRLELLKELTGDIRGASHQEKRIEVLIVLDPAQESSFEDVLQHISMESGFSLVWSGGSGAGPARNHGLSLVQGDWLWFVDSDDRLPTGSIEAVLEVAEKSASDLLLFSAGIINGSVKESAPWINRYKDFAARKRVIRPMDFPGNIFQFTTPSPWNFVYRRSFLHHLDLKFSSLPSSNDVSFVFTALACAREVELSGEEIYLYRRNAPGNSQNSENNFSLPLAAMELRRNLTQRGVLKRLRPSYRKFVRGTVFKWWAAKKPLVRVPVLLAFFLVLVFDGFRPNCRRTG